MIRRRDLIAIVGDLRLTPEAVRIVLDVALRPGDGPHEVPASHFRMLLNNAGERAARFATELAVETGWLIATRGGRGHHNLYGFNPSISAVSNGNNDHAELAGSNGAFDPTKTAGSNRVLDHAETDRSKRGEQSTPKSFDTALNAGSSDDIALFAASNALARDLLNHRTKDVDDDGELDARALEILLDYDALFLGCRGSLKDYLVKHVPGDRQYGYIQTLAMWLNGSRPIFKWPSGEWIAEAQRARLLASALNDLAASDESKMGRPIGDPANLRTKLNVIITQDWEATHEQPARSRNGAGQENARRPAAGSGPEKTGRRSDFVVET